MAVKQITYYVVERYGKWIVTLGEDNVGNYFPTQLAALSAAVWKANYAKASGASVQIKFGQAGQSSLNWE